MWNAEKESVLMVRGRFDVTATMDSPVSYAMVGSVLFSLFIVNLKNFPVVNHNM